MGSETISQVTEQTIKRTHINQLVLALLQNLVPRNSSGVATDGAGSLGTTNIRWEEVNSKKLSLKSGTLEFILEVDPNNSNRFLLKVGTTTVATISEDGFVTTRDSFNTFRDSAEDSLTVFEIPKQVNTLLLFGIGAGTTSSNQTGYYGEIPVYINHGSNKTYCIVREGRPKASLTGAGSALFKDRMDHATNIWIVSERDSQNKSASGPLGSHTLSSAQSFNNFLKLFLSKTDAELLLEYPDAIRPKITPDGGTEREINIRDYMHFSFPGALQRVDNTKTNYGLLDQSLDVDNSSPNEALTSLIFGCLNPEIYSSTGSAIQASPFSIQHKVSGVTDQQAYQSELATAGYFQQFNASFIGDTDKRDGTKTSKGRVIIRQVS